MSTKLAEQSSAPPVDQTGGLPPCPKCGGAVGFAAAPGNAIEWWRCTQCAAFYPIKNTHCAHTPTAAARCATCGGSNIAITLTERKAGHEVTLHFCSLAHARACLNE